MSEVRQVQSLTKSDVESATLAWLESLSWTAKHAPDIAPGEPAAERRDYAQVVMEDRLRQAPARLNPALPAEAREDTFRTLTRQPRGRHGARLDAAHRGE